MKTKEYYKPIKSLINLILTGEREIALNDDPIIVIEEFTNSLTPNMNDTYNLYFLNRIDNFLGTCNNEERVDLLKVYLENDVLVFGVAFMDRLVTKSAMLGKIDLSDNLNSVFFSFVNDREVHPILFFSLYFYVENVLKITIVNGMVSKADYKKVIKYNSIKREIDDVSIF